MKAVVFFADGFEDIEALSPVDYLRRGGVEVTTVAVPSATMKDPKMAESSHNVRICTDMSFDEFKAAFENNLPDCVVCPGGSNGAKNLSINETVLAFLQKMFDSNKLVGAICASPAFVLSKTECPYCQMYIPKIKKISEEYKINTYYVETDTFTAEESSAFSNLINYNATPTTVFIKNGEELSKATRINGNVSEQKIINKFKSNDFIK